MEMEREMLIDNYIKQVKIELIELEYINKHLNNKYIEQDKITSILVHTDNLKKALK